MGEYALSKDADVALWLDYRNFNGDSPLTDVTDFVIVNSELHDEFDDFKKKEVKPHYSFLPLSALLNFYCLSECADLLKSSTIVKYGRSYILLHTEQIDRLVEWVYTMRVKYVKDKTVFMTPVLNMLTAGNNLEIVMLDTMVAISVCLALQVLQSNQSDSSRKKRVLPQLSSGQMKCQKLSSIQDAQRYSN